MKLLIHTRANDSQKSLDYYSILGFDVFSKSEPTIISDGKAFIEISDSPYARPGLKIYNPDLNAIVAKLKKLTIVKTDKDGHLLSDASSLWIYLTEKELDFDINPKEASISVLGNYMGICIETIDLDKSSRIFEALGLNKPLLIDPPFQMKMDLPLPFLSRTIARISFSILH